MSVNSMEIVPVKEVVLNHEEPMVMEKTPAETI